MPKISDIEIQKNNKRRANLYLDGEFFRGVEMITVMKLGLKIGSEISQEKLDEVLFDSEKSAAFDKAADYLARSMKTSAQMRTYLTKKGFSPEVTQAVLDKLNDYRYVDDSRYAELYAEQNSSSKGPRRLKQELISKGIPREQAELAAQSASENASENAAALAEKYMRGKPRDLATLQKLQRWLLFRGYDYDTVYSAVSAYKSDD